MNKKLVRYGLWLVAAAVLVAAAPAEAQWSTAPEAPLPAVVNVSGGAIQLFPSVTYSRAILTVSGGDAVMTRIFTDGESPAIDRFDAEGNYLADGTYSWELELIPDVRTARALRVAASKNGGQAPGAWERQSGSFTILGGKFVIPYVTELGEEGKAEGGSFTSETPALRRFASASGGLDADSSGASEEQVRATAVGAFTPVSPYGAGLQAANSMGLDDSDFIALAAGQALVPNATNAMQPEEARNAPKATRSVEPGGKNGRPETEEE